MNIVLGQENIQDLEGKYVVLSLDKFLIDGRGPITSYCVIENLPIEEMADAPRFQELHEKMMENYAQKNWNFCQQALEHLIGRWNREIDSFYIDFSKRIESYQAADPGPEWRSFIER